MPSVGRILVVCARCGFKLYDYALGDPANRAKYAGPPIPAEAAAPLGARPLEVEVLTRAEFEALYTETRYTIEPRTTTPTAAAQKSVGVTTA
ncbi:MAG: hypothetical protein GSR80_000621 [Desulfurococcales archaeon]|nr:hypothetical protein [Desulfurococcales archaeon]